MQTIQALNSYDYNPGSFGISGNFQVYATYRAVDYGGSMESGLPAYDGSQLGSILYERASDVTFVKPDGLLDPSYASYLAVVPKGVGTVRLTSDKGTIETDLVNMGDAWLVYAMPTSEALHNTAGTIRDRVSLSIDGNGYFDSVSRSWNISFSTRSLKVVAPFKMTVPVDEYDLLNCRFQDVTSQKILEIYDIENNYDNVKYTSSNKKIVTIDDTPGMIKGVRAGTATVTVTATDSQHIFPTIKQEIPVTVTGKKASTIDVFYTRVGVAELGYLAECTKSAGKVSATSSNKSVATVKVMKPSRSGVYVKFSALKPGATKITINIAGNGIYESRKKTFTLRVVKKPTTVSVSKNITKKMKNSFKINAKVYELDAATNKRRGVVPSSNIKLTYASSNPAVASVDKNGQVTTKKTGTATITSSIIRIKRG